MSMDNFHSNTNFNPYPNHSFFPSAIQIQTLQSRILRTLEKEKAKLDMLLKN